ncbi:MAG: hypothetical protein AAF481_13385 [Acidobacteriota bacterium]
MTRRLALLPCLALVVSIGCGAPDTNPDTSSGPGNEPAAAPEPAPAPQARARDDANRIAWRTASEVDNFGYDIYRAESPDGPFERITEQPLEGAGTTDLPSSYEYFDETIEYGKEYFYYVESISMNGERQPFTPVSRAAPKPGPSAREGSEEG